MAQKTWTWMHGTDRTYVEQARISPDMVGGPQDRLSDRETTPLWRVERWRGCRPRRQRACCASTCCPRAAWGSGKSGPAIWPSAGTHPCVGRCTPSSCRWRIRAGWAGSMGSMNCLSAADWKATALPEFSEHGQLRYGLHGRIANKPAHQLEVRADGETGELAVAGIVDETRFHFFKLRMVTTITTRVGESALSIRDTIAEFLGQSRPTSRCSITSTSGRPCWVPGAQVVVPDEDHDAPRQRGRRRTRPIGPAIRQPQANTPEQVYFFDLQGDDQQQTAVLLKDPQASARRERALQHAATALLHAVEEPDSGSRWLCDRPGTGHQLSQSPLL